MMGVLHSDLDTSSEIFAENKARVEALVADLQAHAVEVCQGGGDAARARHVERGKLLPRDRVHR